MPEATLSFTEGDHLLSSAVLPGEIQSVAKQSWWTQAVKWGTVLVPDTGYVLREAHSHLGDPSARPVHQLHHHWPQSPSQKSGSLRHVRPV